MVACRRMGASLVREAAFQPPYRSYDASKPPDGFLWVENLNTHPAKGEKLQIPAVWWPMVDPEPSEYCSCSASLFVVVCRILFRFAYLRLGCL